MHMFTLCKTLWKGLTGRCFPVLCALIEDYCCCAWQHAFQAAERGNSSSSEAVERRCCFGGVESVDVVIRRVCTRGPDEVSLRLHPHIVSYLFDLQVLRSISIWALTTPGLLYSIRWRDAYHNLIYLTRIAVCDQRNNRIKIMRLDGFIERIIGCVEPVGGAASSEGSEDSFGDVGGDGDGDDLFDEPEDEGTVRNIPVSPSPSGLALLPSGMLAVSEFRGNSVAIVDPRSGEFIRRFPVGVFPRGICVTSDGHIAVCLFGSVHVAIFTEEGDLVRRVLLRLAGPSGIASLPDGQLVVSECNANRVVMLDPCGCAVETIVKHVWGSGAYSPTLHDFSEPRGVTYIPQVGVDSGNSRIKVMELDGTVHRCIPGDYDCMSSIAMLHDGHHAVVSDCDNHRLVVIKWSDGSVLTQLGTGEASRGTDDFCHPRCMVVLPT
eukprot:CAMPEP_0176418016 /NCGR_PEP_ID=MMETSP0127-20121128/7217_1 /TAXON_ID=938130 /ORGANISM="Platyophrya macrostoma, Strain WH" /LENGTH=435 /DNA_ID=CAMNT_0017798255 /DNA_START=10 /DNA_END=1314 /DNA_ORIENTATION=+